MSRRFAFALVAFSSLALACAEKPLGVDPSPLDGLLPAEGNDSSGAPPPPPSTNSGPGYVRGTVLGPSGPGAGNDSLTTAPRVAGVRITAYPRIQPTPSDTLGIGPAAASVVTGADGLFQLPVLPAGEYLITFNPPEGSIYGGVW